jgi:hypothetical protein
MKDYPTGHFTAPVRRWWPDWRPAPEPVKPKQPPTPPSNAKSHAWPGAMVERASRQGRKAW